jgi:hypothetical protein
LASRRGDVYVESSRLHPMVKARKSIDALSCVASMSSEKVIRLVGYIKALLAIPLVLVRYSIISAARKFTSVPHQRCLVEQHNSAFSNIITTKPICRSSLHHATAHDAHGILRSFPPTRPTQAQPVRCCLSRPRVRQSVSKLTLSHRPPSPDTHHHNK